MTKKEIDLTKYKNDSQVGTLFHEYNLEQVNEMQVSKQADVLLLLFLFENLFPKEEKRLNWDYYEPKTLHDSSLSLSTHAILAADLGEIALSYDLFQQAINIDMGENMLSSNEGIHAASLGGIWQMTVFRKVLRSPTMGSKRLSLSLLIRFICLKNKSKSLFRGK